MKNKSIDTDRMNRRDKKDQNKRITEQKEKQRKKEWKEVFMNMSESGILINLYMRGREAGRQESREVGKQGGREAGWQIYNLFYL